MPFKETLFSRFYFKVSKGKGSSLGKFTSAEDDVVDEGCGSFWGGGCSGPSYPLPQETSKVGERVPMEEGSS